MWRKAHDPRKTFRFSSFLKCYKHSFAHFAAHSHAYLGFLPYSPRSHGISFILTMQNTFIVCSMTFSYRRSLRKCEISCTAWFLHSFCQSAPKGTYDKIQIILVQFYDFYIEMKRFQSLKNKIKNRAKYSRWRKIPECDSRDVKMKKS